VWKFEKNSRTEKYDDWFFLHVICSQLMPESKMCKNSNSGKNPKLSKCGIAARVIDHKTPKYKIRNQ